MVFIEKSSRIVVMVWKPRPSKPGLGAPGAHEIGKKRSREGRRYCSCRGQHSCLFRGRLKHATFQISVTLWEGYFAPLPMMNSTKYTASFYIPEQPVVRRARRGSLVKNTRFTRLHPGSSNSPTTHTPLRKPCKCFWKHANATFHQLPDFNPKRKEKSHSNDARVKHDDSYRSRLQRRALGAPRHSPSLCHFRISSALYLVAASGQISRRVLKTRSSSYTAPPLSCYMER